MEDGELYAGVVMLVHSLQLHRDSCSYLFPDKAIEFHAMYQSSSVPRYAALLQYERDFTKTFGSPEEHRASLRSSMSEEEVNAFCSEYYASNLAYFDDTYRGRYDDFSEFWASFNKELSEKGGDSLSALWVLIVPPVISNSRHS